MNTPGQLFEAEQQIHDWHSQPSGRGGSVDGTRYQERSPLAALWSRLRSTAGLTVATPMAGAVTAGGVSVEALLQAVARGELSPRAAHEMVQGRISTLALLQAVAWGEISPNAARHLLAQQV